MKIASRFVTLFGLLLAAHCGGSNSSAEPFNPGSSGSGFGSGSTSGGSGSSSGGLGIGIGFGFVGRRVGLLRRVIFRLFGRLVRFR